MAEQEEREQIDIDLFDIDPREVHVYRSAGIPDNTGWEVVNRRAYPAQIPPDYFVERSFKIDSGFVRYDTFKEASVSAAVPAGYELYSFRYDELSRNGTIEKLNVYQAGPDSIKVDYKVISDGHLLNKERGWLSLQVWVRGRLIEPEAEAQG